MVALLPYRLNHVQPAIRFKVATRTKLGILAEREQLLALPVDKRR